MKFPVALLLFAAVPVFAAGNAPTTPVAALPPADANYELRGFFGSGAELEVSLAPKGEKDSRWYAVGKKIGGLTVEKADAIAGYAVISRGGVRSVVRLAVSSGPRPVEPEEDAPAAAPEAAKPDYSNREYRWKRWGEIMGKYSPSQKAEFGRVAQERFASLKKEHPEYFSGAYGTTGPSEENLQKLSDASMSIIHDAAEASAKFPDADGRINPLPDDFDAIMRAEQQDNRAQRKRHREEQAAKAQAAETGQAANGSPEAE